MARHRIGLLASIFVFIVALALSAAIEENHYLLLSVLFVIGSMVPFFFRFERRRMEAREIILIAVLAAIASMGRVAFAPIPSVQPTSFVIIIAAVVFGGETGFMIGAIAALASNIFLGQGPWTPWQMFCWGMIGATAGWLRHTWVMRTRFGMCAFGFIWGFVFGWIMNIWYLISLPDAMSWPLVVTAYIQSFYFDLAHALANVFFLGILGVSWVQILQRFKKKYGLLKR